MEEKISSNYFIRDGVLYKSCPSCSKNINKEVFYECPEYFGFRGTYSQSQCNKCRSENHNAPFDGYVLKSDIDKTIPEIRILPMGKEEFPSIDECKLFLTKEMPDIGNLFYYRTHNMITQYNSLILFQYDARIIGYGFFESEKEEDDGEYKGYYKFINNSIKYLSRPITNQEMFQNFKVKLAQGTTKISINYLPKLLELLTNGDDINFDELYDYNKPRVKSVEDWIKILIEEQKRDSDKILRILEFMYGQKNFTSNLSKIAVYLDQEGNLPIFDIVHFGKRIIKITSIEEIYREDRKEYLYWNIPFTTVESLNKGIFTYKLRPELVKAIEIVFPNWNKDIDEPLFSIEQEIKKINKRKKFSLNDKVNISGANLEIVKYKETDKTITPDIEKNPNYAKRAIEEAINSHDGKVIEDYIFDLEYDKLKNQLSKNQLNEMKDFYYNKKDRYGYDILSFELENGKYVKKYIEVKSTKKNEKTPIDISRNEVEFARENIDHYYIYRVIIVDDSNLKISEIKGHELFEKYDLVPMNYKIYGNK